MSPEQITSDQLDRTIVTAHPRAAVDAGVNLVYCASFQIAWNKLLDEIVQEPLQMEGNPLAAQVLNERLVSEQDLDPDCYVALAGFARDDIVERVTQALWAKFERAPGFRLDLGAPDAILAYTYLEKSLPFDTEFEVFEEPLLFADGVAVQSFGVEQETDAVDQVVILAYQHPDDFVLRLRGLEWVEDEIQWGAFEDRPRISGDLILAKVEPRTTLLETIQAVLSRSTREAWYRAREKALQAGRDPRKLLSRKLEDDEVLKIPKIDLDLLHRYEELAGKKWLNTSVAGNFITDALQAIKFRLDETGADLKSEAAMLTFGLSSAEEQPRQFIFDKPFLLLLKEKDSQNPYLAIWVANSELLVKV